VCGLCLAAAAGSASATEHEPEPGQLAFETPAGIHLIRTDGTGLQRLLGTRPGDQNPDWSPDGTRLVFWNGSLATETGEIYVSDADGSNRRLLTRHNRKDPRPPSDQYPVWSPDGRLIAFEALSRDDEWHIWVMRFNGTGVRRVTRDGFGGSSPSWSPDGKRLVYTASWSGTSLAIVDLSGRTRALKTLSEADWAPEWSPDGSRIAFTSTAEHQKPELYVVGTTGGTTSRLTRNTATDSDPVWSPDGAWIVFSSLRDGLDEVYAMRADGTDQRRVTRIPTEYACCADWKPEP
jgi:TolB protein